MQLSLHADYALRLLLYAGAHPGETFSTGQVSRAYGISRNHLVRVVRTLAQAGYLRVSPGRNGGVRLAKDPVEIRLGEVVRRAEPNLHLVECFDERTNTCPIIGVCGLKAHLQAALRAFLTELDRHTLAELLTGDRAANLAAALHRIAPAPAPVSVAPRKQAPPASRARRLPTKQARRAVPDSSR